MSTAQAGHVRERLIPLARADERRSTAMWLGALGLAVFGLLFLSALAAPRPSIFPDEFVYWRLQQSVAHSGHFSVFGAHFSPWSFGVLYPVVLAPLVWLPLSAASLYHLDQAVSCFFFATSVVPAYLLSRRLLRRRSALLATVALVAVPSSAYADHLMTESLGYPLFLWAVLACWHALDEPGRLRLQLVALGAIALATLARAELAVLLPAYVCAVLVVRRRSRATLLIAGAVLAAAAALVIGWSSLVGQHRTMFADFAPAEAPRWMLYNFIGVEVYVGVIPLVLAPLVIWRWLAGTDPRRRHLAVLAVAVGGWLLALVGTYVTQRPSAGVYDRYTFYLAPLVLLGFADWLERDRNVPRRLQIALVILIAAPLALPYQTIFTDKWGLAVNLGLLPVYVLKQGLSWPVFYAVLAGLLAFVAAAFLNALRRREIQPIVVVVVALVAFTGLIAHLSNGVATANAGDCLADSRWVSREEPRIQDAVVVWSGRDDHDTGCAIWQSMFFNPELARLYTLGPSLGRLHEQRVTLVRGALRLGDGRALGARYVLSDAALPGRVIARDAPSRLRLYDLGGR